MKQGRRGRKLGSLKVETSSRQDAESNRGTEMSSDDRDARMSADDESGKLVARKKIGEVESGKL